MLSNSILNRYLPNYEVRPRLAYWITLTFLLHDSFCSQVNGSRAITWRNDVYLQDTIYILYTNSPSCLNLDIRVSVYTDDTRTFGRVSGV